MTNAEALILLVRTLSKNEKRSFRLGKKSTADYIVLFDLMTRMNSLLSMVSRKLSRIRGRVRFSM